VSTREGVSANHSPCANCHSMSFFDWRCMWNSDRCFFNSAN